MYTFSGQLFQEAVTDQACFKQVIMRGQDLTVKAQNSISIGPFQTIM